MEKKKKGNKWIFALFLIVAIATPSAILTITRKGHEDEIDYSLNSYTFPETGEVAKKRIVLSALDFPDGRVLWSYKKNNIAYPIENFSYYTTAQLTNLSIELYPNSYYPESEVIYLNYQNIDGSYSRDIRLKVTYIPVTSLDLSQNSLEF
jgi:hypothetical protein